MSLRRQIKDTIVTGKITILSSMRDIEGKRFIPVEVMLSILKDIERLI